MLARFYQGWRLLQVRDLRLRAGRCPFCGPSMYVRLSALEHGVRCLRCAASAVHLTLGWALRREVPDIEQCDACELSARGPLVAWLRRNARSLECSEYFADAQPGEMRNGIRCEDMQALSYADASFDLITHTEVLEHVPDDARALAELRRVLRPGGRMLFTVPMHAGTHTVERARLRPDGSLEHMLAPVYHNDPLREEGILAFRDYGRDILQRLRAAGFESCRFMEPSPGVPWVALRGVIAARVPQMQGC